jgi:hypothetical protein
MPQRGAVGHDAAMPSAAARMTATPAAPPVRRLMLVPSASARSEEGVRRFRLALRRLEGRESTRAALQR